MTRSVEIQSEVYHFENISESDFSKIGGKAKGLFRLHEMGFLVPDWMVIRFSPMTSEKELQRKIDSCFSDKDTSLFAVRSSAIFEDGKQLSFAGQFSSYLNVKKENLTEFVLKVKQSYFNSNLANYTNSLGGEMPGMISVIIQEMVEADAAGVLFSACPVTGNRNKKIIHAVKGLADELVSGKRNPESHIVENGEVRIESLGENHSPVLTSFILEELIQNSDVIFQYECIHHDLEYAVKDGQVYMLQYRPLTTLTGMPDSGAKKMLWDNSNIGESYPGITSPLTFSFIKKMYESVYVNFVRIMGVSRKEVLKNKHLFQNMLGRLQGRVYYNLRHWYEVVAMLPGYSFNASFMEKMMGVSEVMPEKELEKMSKSKAFFRLIISLVKMIYKWFSLPRETKVFHKGVNDVFVNYEGRDFSACSPRETMEEYLKLEEVLLKKWEAPLVNDFFAMISFGVSEKLCEKYTGNKELHASLISGSGDMISTKPLDSMRNITRLIHADSYWTSLMENKQPIAIELQLRKLNDPVASAIRKHIQIFGARCTGELKLETRTYQEEPVKFIALIQQYVKKEIEIPVLNSDLYQSALKEVKSIKNPIRKFILNYWIKQTKRLVSGRENMRFERTRAFAIARKMFLGIGARFQAEGILHDQKDIFYLGMEEVFSYLNGTALQEGLRQLVALRKEEEKSFNSTKPNSRITTYGIPYQNPFNISIRKEAIQGDIQGEGCSKGIVRGKVRRVYDPFNTKLVKGEILLAEFTDPGWITLFPAAAGIIVERGSQLSHSAIVSRELGIPCIVKAEGIMDTLNDGDEIEMDGSTGAIRRCKM